MGKISVVPYGPQHPVLPEPIHLDLVIEDEKVIEAVPSIGFIHRGLEGLVEKEDYNKMLYVVERACGICSFQHGMGYCEAIEHIIGVEVPERAKYLRTIWAEFSRMHSHLLWAGLMADAFGFENLYYQCFRIREKVLDLVELTTGGRLIYSVNKIGGVLKDIDKDKQKIILDTIADMEKEIKVVTKTFLNDYTVESRLKGVGILTTEKARETGATGPFGRASGINIDMRKLGYAAYSNIDFEPIISTRCDSYARCEVRLAELLQSIDIIRQAIAKMPDETDLAATVKGNPDGEYFMRVEQPRGEAYYYVKGHGKPNLDRCRIRTPTFANLSGLCEMLKNCELSDVGILVVTIDPCVSCIER